MGARYKSNIYYSKNNRTRHYMDGLITRRIGLNVCRFGGRLRLFVIEGVIRLGSKWPFLYGFANNSKRRMYAI